MKLTPGTLAEHGFILNEKVKHSQFNKFLSTHKWMRSRFHYLYIGLVLLFVTMTIAFFILSSNLPLFRIIHAGLGVLLALVIVPLHEYVHFLTYKYFGATNVKISTYLRKQYVLTHADQFVVTKQEMKWIAPMPFIILSMFGLSILWFSNDLWQISICTFLLFHISLCQADFQVLDYFLSSEDEIALYDDVKNRVTYIYKQSKK